MKKLKKIEFNNFICGLIFGAIFSLLINLITVQIQETIQKQKILEAIENEILTNTLDAKNILEQNKEIITKKETPNIFHAFFKYSNDFWTQSTEPLQYIVQLNPDIQIEIAGYYSVVIKTRNNMIAKYEEIAKDKLKNCYDFSLLNQKEKDVCNLWYWDILDWEASTAKDIANNGFKLLEKFHPTQDRKKNILLKLFMGNQSIRVLSGK